MANPSLKCRWAIFIALSLIALAIRLPRLNERPMHVDEAVNAYILGQVLDGKTFHYDPRDRHGPALFALAEPLVLSCGARRFSDLSEWQVRLGPVLAGTATVLLFGAATEMFGFVTCLVAAGIFAISPLPVFYNRYFIHESLLVAATFGLMLSAWRTQKTHSLFHAALAGFCAALMLSCKETAVLSFFALIGAAIACRMKNPKVRYFSGSYPVRLFLVFTAVFTLTVTLLFTWFGRNWGALVDLVKAVPDYVARAAGEGHQGPFWYYLGLLGSGWSGVPILGLALLAFFGAIRCAVCDSKFFLAIYASLIFAIYSVIPYKTPWLAMNIWLPLTLLAGMASEWIWSLAKVNFARVGTLMLAIGLGILIVHDTWQWVFANPAAQSNPYTYAQTGNDILRLAPRLEQLAKKRHLAEPLIAVVAADPWPLPWYLRNFSEVGFWQPGQDPGPADFYITTTDVPRILTERLRHFRPEYFGDRPNVLLVLWSPIENDSRHE